MSHEQVARLMSQATLEQQGLFVVIPAYNEAATVRDIAERALREAAHVIVVDDGSSDATAAALHGLPLTVLRNAENLGKSASLRRGMVHALEHGASAVITLDADGQHEPEDIPRLVAAHRASAGDAIVVGARLRDKDKFPRARYAANRCANFWIGWAAGYTMADSQSGFRLYPAALLKALDIANYRSRAFVLESALLIDAARLGVQSVPVRISAIYQKHNRPSHFRPVIDVLLITRMVAWKLLTSGLNLRALVRSRRCPKSVPRSDPVS